MLPYFCANPQLLPLQTAEFIVGPKWAIARDPSIYNPAAAPASNGKLTADRGPPMVWPPP